MHSRHPIKAHKCQHLMSFCACLELSRMQFGTIILVLAFAPLLPAVALLLLAALSLHPGAPGGEWQNPLPACYPTSSLMGGLSMRIFASRALFWSASVT